MSKVQWIKVSTDILHNRKIMALRYEKNGNQIILLWIYLLVLAGQTNDSGNIYFTPTIPYDQEKLSKELNIQKPIIASGLDYFQKNEMVKILENGWIRIENWEEYQNFEQLERIREGNKLRQKRYYQTHRTNTVLTPNLTPPTPLDNATDKNRIDVDVEKNRKELDLDKTLINKQIINDTKFIEELNNENPNEILYDKHTDLLLKHNFITSTDANLHHHQIQQFFSKLDDKTIERLLKSFTEKRVNGRYILKFIGIQF